MGPCIAFVGCTFHCDQTNEPKDIFLVPLETLSQGQLIGTNYASLGANVWPQENKNSTAVFRVKYTVGSMGLCSIPKCFHHLWPTPNFYFQNLCTGTVVLVVTGSPVMKMTTG